MESGILLIDTIHAGVGIVAGSLLADSIYIVAHSSFNCDRLREIVNITARNILFPDDDGVVGSCVRIPFCVNISVGVQLITENESCPSGVPSFCSWRTKIPSVKGVTVATHNQCGFHRGLACPHKVGSLVGCSLTVLVVDQPVTFGDVNLEHHIATYCNAGAVGVNTAIVRMSNDISPIGRRVDFPSFEVVVVVIGCVRYIHRVTHRGCCRIGTVKHRPFGCNYGSLLVEICHVVALEQHGVEVHLGAVCNSTVQSGLDGSAHLINGHTAACVSDSIGVALPPAFARHAGSRCAHSGVIDYGVVISLTDIRFLYIEGHISSVGTVEGYFQTGIVAGLGNDIYRE